MQELLEESILKNLQIKDKRMKLELGKTYITRAGEKVRIICTDRKSKSGTMAIGLVAVDGKNETIYTYYSNGKVGLGNVVSNYDLVKEYSPWDNVKIDTKILIRDNENDKWQRAYFAGYKNGEVYAFIYGGTSYSQADVLGWKYAKLAEGLRDEDI